MAREAPQQPALGVRFYTSPAGGKVTREELDALSPFARAEVVALIKRRANRECFTHEDRQVRKDLRELRTSYDGQEYRVFYCLEGQHDQIVLALVICEKKGQQIPAVIDNALRRMKDWRNRGN